jgi:hypothetical protein
MSDSEVWVAWGWTAQGQLPTAVYIGTDRGDAVTALNAAATGVGAIVYGRLQKPFLLGASSMDFNFGASW